MTRSAFYSFHYANDAWRASLVRNMGVIDGNRPAKDNDWETIKKGGGPAIANWIDGQMYGTSVAIVLIGEKTAGRKWINYEIQTAWEKGKGVLGVYIHGLKNRDGKTSWKGKNPFSGIAIKARKRIGGLGGYGVGDTVLLNLGSIVHAHNPESFLGFDTSKEVYAIIKENLGDWIEKAIAIRSRYA